jgi:hypothetical protein
VAVACFKIVFRDFHKGIEVNYEETRSERPDPGHDLNPVEESDALSLCKPFHWPQAVIPPYGLRKTSIKRVQDGRLSGRDSDASNTEIR